MKLLRKFFAATALPTLFALTALQPGCMHRGPTDVAQGQKYQTGDPTYDLFFARVHALSREVGQAPEKERDARIALGKVLDMDMEEEIIEQPAATPGAASPAAPEATPGAPDPTAAYTDQLKQSAINAVPGAAQVQGVKAQVDQLKGMFNGISAATSTPAAAQPATPAAPVVKKEIRPPSASLLAKTVKSQAEELGLLLKLEVKRDEDSSVATLKSGGEESKSDAQELREAVEKAAKTGLELFVRMEKAKKRLEMLSKMSEGLEASVDNVFRKQGAGKASEVKKNVADARELIKLMQSRVSEVHGKADQLVSKLEEVANADLDMKPATDTAVATSEVPKAEEPKAETTPVKPQKSKTVDSEKPKKRAPAAAPKAGNVGDFVP